MDGKSSALPPSCGGSAGNPTSSKRACALGSYKGNRYSDSIPEKPIV